MTSPPSQVQRGHHEGARKVHGGHSGGRGENGAAVCAVFEGPDAGPGDFPAPGLYPGERSRYSNV